MDNFEPHSLYLFDKKAIKESYRIQITHSVVSAESLPFMQFLLLHEHKHQTILKVIM